jgi:hypothetical protein
MTSIRITLLVVLQSFLNIITKRNRSWRGILQNPRARMTMKWNERERERESWKSSSITIAQDMVSWEREKGSIYTWRGKPTPLGSKPSVHHQAIE